MAANEQSLGVISCNLQTKPTFSMYWKLYWEASTLGSLMTISRKMSALIMEVDVKPMQPQWSDSLSFFLNH